MARTSDVSEALATLQARWGSAAPRRGGDLLLHPVEGALARVAVPVEEPDDAPDDAPTPLVPTPRHRPAEPAPDLDGRIVPTGFAALDAILGTGGLPRTATVALRGQGSSGRTTVGLRVAAEAQAGGAIVAWLDLARAFDPVEAVSRGVNPEWLVVLTPQDLEEALAMAGTLLAARTVDLLVMDLPDGRDPAVAGKRVGDRLGRLAALARRAGTLLLVLEPVALGRALAAAVAEASGLRLELRRSGWIRAWAGTWWGSGARWRSPATATARRVATRSSRSGTRRAAPATPACSATSCSTARRRVRHREPGPRRLRNRTPRRNPSS